MDIYSKIKENLNQRDLEKLKKRAIAKLGGFTIDEDNFVEYIQELGVKFKEEDLSHLIKDNFEKNKYFRLSELIEKTNLKLEITEKQDSHLINYINNKQETLKDELNEFKSLDCVDEFSFKLNDSNPKYQRTHLSLKLGNFIDEIECINQIRQKKVDISDDLVQEMYLINIRDNKDYMINHIFDLTNIKASDETISRIIIEDFNRASDFNLIEKIVDFNKIKSKIQDMYKKHYELESTDADVDSFLNLKEIESKTNISLNPNYVKKMLKQISLDIVKNKPSIGIEYLLSYDLNNKDAILMPKKLLVTKKTTSSNDKTFFQKKIDEIFKTYFTEILGHLETNKREFNLTYLTVEKAYNNFSELYGKPSYEAIKEARDKYFDLGNHEMLRKLEKISGDKENFFKIF